MFQFQLIKPPCSNLHKTMTLKSNSNIGLCTTLVLFVVIRKEISKKMIYLIYSNEIESVLISALCHSREDGMSRVIV